jgi:hypothetical protein
VVTAWIAAFNSGAADGVAALYAEGAVNRQVARGLPLEPP